MAESKRIPATHVWVLRIGVANWRALSPAFAQEGNLFTIQTSTRRKRALKASIECLGIHSAMLKIRGMSLHRYLRLRRLWARQETVARWRQDIADQSMRTFRWLLASGRVCGSLCRPIWRSTVNNSGSLAAAAIMKNGATDRIPALDWAQRHGLPSSNVKITRNSGRIRGAACNDQIKQECITVFHGR